MSLWQKIKEHQENIWIVSMITLVALLIFATGYKFGYDSGVDDSALIIANAMADWIEEGKEATDSVEEEE